MRELDFEREFDEVLVSEDHLANLEKFVAETKDTLEDIAADTPPSVQRLLLGIIKDAGKLLE